MSKAQGRAGMRHEAVAAPKERHRRAGHVGADHVPVRTAPTRNDTVHSSTAGEFVSGRISP